MNNEIMKREIKEALDAGERALCSLRQAQEKLSSAKNWGLMDMLGGNIFTGMMKHSRMQDSLQYIEQAKQDLEIFERELRDVNIASELQVEVGRFLTFADFVLDNFFTDYLVQQKISDAREQVDTAVERVEQLLGHLKAMYGYS